MTLGEIGSLISGEFWFLACKSSNDPKSTWTLCLSSPSLALLKTVSYNIAHRGAGAPNMPVYVIVRGHTDKPVEGPFYSVYDYEIRSNRIVDVV